MKENDIRPQALFAEYLRLAAIDAEMFFSNTPNSDILCPACAYDAKFAFSKLGFSYKECVGCKTLFVSPRPHKAAFDLYYKDSPSTEYWASSFYKATADERRIKLWRPKAKLVADKLSAFNINISSVIDIGGGYGIFAEEFSKISNIRPIVIEPSVHLSTICKNKGFTVIEKFFEDVNIGDLPHGYKCFVSFELFEHLHSPELFLCKLADLSCENDIFIFTTLSGMGLDIRVLWEDSNAVFPPHHLNFFNPKSIKILLQRYSFEIIEISTPGKLDIDILKNNKEKIKDKFWLDFLNYANEDEIRQMQQAIADNLLSSHMMIVCKKK